MSTYLNFLLKVEVEIIVKQKPHIKQKIKKIKKKSTISNFYPFWENIVLDQQKDGSLFLDETGLQRKIRQIL